MTVTKYKGGDWAVTKPTTIKNKLACFGASFLLLTFGGAQSWAFSIGEPGTSIGIGVGVGERTTAFVGALVTEVEEVFDDIPSK
jgi:hypothetical protein